MKKILSIVMVLVMLLALCGCDKLDYDKAMKAYDNGDYAEARELFSELGDYEDSAEMVQDCDYRIARKAMDDEEYEEALEILEELDDYKESEELVMECRYSLALAQMEDGEYEEAAEALTELGDYEDAAQQLQECDYQLALKAMEDGKTDEALQKLTALGDYKDCAELISGMLCDQLVGQWVANFDATQTMNQIVEAATAGTDIMSYMNLENVIMRFDMEIYEDHSVTIDMDSDSLIEIIDQVKSAMVAAMKDYYPVFIQEVAEQNNLTIDDLYTAYEVDNMDDLIVALLEGQTIEELVDESFDAESMGDVTGYDAYSGTLYAENGQIGINSSDDSIQSISYDAATDTIHVTIGYIDLTVEEIEMTFTRK